MTAPRIIHVLPIWCRSKAGMDLIAEVIATRPEVPFGCWAEDMRYPGRAARSLDRLYLEWFGTTTDWTREDILAVEEPFALIKRVLAEDEAMALAPVERLGHGRIAA